MRFDVAIILERAFAGRTPQPLPTRYLPHQGGGSLAGNEASSVSSTGSGYGGGLCVPGTAVF